MTNNTSDSISFTFDAKEKEVFSASIGNEKIDWGLHTIMAPVAWEKTKGEGIKVAILDTGIDLNHPDLITNIKKTANFTRSHRGVEDVQGHGTHVAGIVAGVDNDRGIIGVAPHAEIYAAKVLGDNGSGSYEDIIEGIEWARKNKVDIINMSLGTHIKPPKKFHDAIKRAYEDGIILIAATGNENTKVGYPAKYDEVLAVSAIDRDFERANFSNYGLKNEIIAPGVDILSTYRNGKYAKLSGTSMATPIITGAAALLASYIKKRTHQLPTVETVHRVIQESAVDLGKKGKDHEFGAGLINLARMF